MSSKKVSVFLVSHGSIDARFEGKLPEESVDTESEPIGHTIYDFSIHCEDLPKNTRLCMPNILGKPYYENRDNMIEFIKSKINDWNHRQQPHAVPHKESLKRPRSPEPNSFSDFIAETLTTFEKDETAEMFDLMDECDKRDSDAYDKGHKLSIAQKELRRGISKAITQKNGIKWEELGCYIPEKHYNLTERPGEDVLVVIEEIGDSGTRTVRNVVDSIGLITGRINLAQVNDELRILLNLKDTDEICFFDFACSTFNFTGIPELDPELEPYWPNLLSYVYQDNDDGSATLIYGTIPKVRCEEMTTAEKVGQKGVSFGDSPTSVLELHSQPLSEGSQTSLAAKPTPLLHVRVPKEAKPTINFGQVVFEAGRASGGVASDGPGSGSHGGKRKYTKRKRNLKKSYRKRRVVTRRRYNTRRYSKMNR